MEPHTIVGLLTPSTLFIFAVGFWLAWRWAPEMKQSRTLAFSYGTFGLGFVIPVLLADFIPRFAYLICGALAMIGLALLAQGVFQRFKGVAPLKTLCSLVMLNLASDYYTLFQLNDPGLSLQFSSIIAGLMLSVTAWGMRQLERKTQLEKMVPIAIIVFGTFVIAHPILAFGYNNTAMTYDEFGNSITWVGVNMAVMVSTTVTAMTLTAMTVVDITNRLQESANTDSLSGLPRRGVFEQDAEMILKRANRSPLPLTMITCDIDNFKQINDKFGHLAGDAVIAQLGSIIGGAIRITDAAGRLGGEEFGILLWNANTKSARLIAEQMRTVFADTEYDGLMEGHHCTASFGIAQYDKGESYKSLFARADQALYHAKDSGRDRVISFETRALAA